MTFRILLQIVLICVICPLQTPLVLAGETGGIDVERLADSIYKAEGGAKTRHPYGILAKYKKTTPRQACINTIKSGLRRWEAGGKLREADFIVFLSRTYCPIGAKNDPTGLNVNWVKNVKFYYNRIK